MEIQPFQIYSESSVHLLARYIFPSHPSLLWDTSGASIANVSLDVKKSIVILGKMIYVKLAG